MAGFASVETYIASLPGGIDAYPDCTHKGEPLAVWLQRSPTAGLAGRLPAQAEALLAAASDVPTWVPEVHANVLYLAIREAHFEDDAAFLAHARECNRAVLDTPMNRIVFWVASPRAILRGAGVRWRSLHLGTSIALRAPSHLSAEMEMTFPHKLFPEIVLRGSGTGFAAALENAGARDVVVDLRLVEPTRASYAARWR
ncbi:MAG: hypothetical protein ACLP1X_32525 [Polyangiaceae bacterium]|jgi:hypothetical protein